MSETTVADPARAGGATNPESETRARVMGWKPKEQYKGDPEKWVPADEFLDRGLASPAIMAERLQFMGDRLARQERDNQQLNSKFDEAVGTIQTMTTMMRSSEKRSYDRAKAELEAERDKAVETGDTATFKRVDTEMRELERSAPVTMPGATAAPVTPAPGGRAASANDPAVQAFYQRNPWYSRDPMLTQEADIIHTGLVNARPDMTVAQNLAEVERRLKTYFPDRFNGAAAPAALQAEVENPRREEPGAVSPASATAPARRQTTRRGFANMPQESKTAYVKYKKMLEGHGEPLSEQEWSDDYWSQFSDGET